MILLLITLAYVCRHILLNIILFGVVCDVHHMVDVEGYETGLHTHSRVAAYTCACRANFFLSNAEIGKDCLNE